MQLLGPLPRQQWAIISGGACGAIARRIGRPGLIPHIWQGLQNHIEVYVNTVIFPCAESHNLKRSPMLNRWKEKSFILLTYAPDDRDPLSIQRYL